MADIFEVTRGDGPVEMVWLHGWGHSHAAFLPLARAFDRRARNRLLDLPGFGASPMLVEGADSADYARAVADHLGPPPGPRVLIGHSYGAGVAVQLAARWPDQIAGLVLIAGAGIPRDRSVAWRLRAGALKLLGRLARLAGPRALDAYRRRFGSADYRAAGALRATLVAAVTSDLTEQARTLTAPVVLIYGADDTETPPQIGEKYAAAIPGAVLKVLPGYGHLDILTRGAHQCEKQIAGLLERMG